MKQFRFSMVTFLAGYTSMRSSELPGLQRKHISLIATFVFVFGNLGGYSPATANEIWRQAVEKELAERAVLITATQLAVSNAIQQVEAHRKGVEETAARSAAELQQLKASYRASTDDPDRWIAGAECQKLATIMGDSMWRFSRSKEEQSAMYWRSQEVCAVAIEKNKTERDLATAISNNEVLAARAVTENAKVLAKLQKSLDSVDNS